MSSNEPTTDQNENPPQQNSPTVANSNRTQQPRRRFNTGNQRVNQRLNLLANLNNNGPIGGNLGSYEGMFMHYLFINMAMKYLRFFKPNIRRLIEFFVLVNAVLMFFLLVYIHQSFVSTDSYCLSNVEGIWPKSGILRVQVTRNTTLPKYRMFFAEKPFKTTYTKYEQSKSDLIVQHSMPYSLKDLIKMWESPQSEKDGVTRYDRNQFARWSLHMFANQTPAFGANIRKLIKLRMMDSLDGFTVQMSGGKSRIPEFFDLNKQYYEYEANSGSLNFEVSELRNYYGVEFSLEFGYLRLSQTARSRLKIPTLVVNLHVDEDKCFGGNGVKAWLLDSFLGYDDFIMSNIKRLAEKGNTHGFLRNLVTGDYFRFEPTYNKYLSTLISFITMVAFTVGITMLLRYAYRQIFVAMVEVMRMVDQNQHNFVFPIGPGPLFTIILALVGMEEIMLEFFRDSSVAFYVIIIIWVADQFDLVCLNSAVSKHHWIRFFYMYHFAFYLYHHRFSGRFNKLALLASWLFTFHSMIYFLHHYELPSIQRQLRLLQPQQQNSRNSGNRGNPQTRQTPRHQGGGDDQGPTTSGAREDQNNPAPTDNEPSASSSSGDSTGPTTRCPTSNPSTQPNGETPRPQLVVMAQLFLVVLVVAMLVLVRRFNFFTLRLNLLGRHQFGQHLIAV